MSLSRNIGKNKSERVAELRRQIAATLTHATALRRGRNLDMWIGCGYPRSGTVWLCQLMSIYLDKPYPRDYQSPITMSSVIHAHWLYDCRIPPTVYITRDGRDVLVSLYFYQIRMLSIPRNPRRTKQLKGIFHSLYGSTFDPQDIRANLPKFIEYEMTHRLGFRLATWPEHVREWSEKPHVAQVTYEQLLADTAGELHKAMLDLDTPAAKLELAELAARRYDFALASGRTDRSEDRGDFMRKGIAGDWRNHFTREAGEVFDYYAGDVLVDKQYEASRNWYEGL